MDEQEVLSSAAVGDLAAVAKFVAGGGRIDGPKQQDGRGILLEAVAKCGAAQNVILSLVNDFGASLATKDKKGYNVFHYCVERVGDKDNAVLKVLLEDLANMPGLPSLNEMDNMMFSPLHLACIRGERSVVQLLLRYGADIDAMNDKGSTPLHWACSRGHTDIVKLLVGIYGADFSCAAKNGGTPLHWAASKGHVAVVEVLVGIYCADVEVRDDRGCTPLFMACLNGHTQVVDVLAKRFGASFAPDKKGMTPLHAACEMGHAALAKLLVQEYGQDLEKMDKRKTTPLGRACRANQGEVFEVLVEALGAGLKSLTSKGSNLLHLACEGGAENISRSLLEEHNFDVNAVNDDGDTPVLCAAAKGHSEMVQYLVELHDADPKAVDKDGRNAIHKAVQCKDLSTVDVLASKYGVEAKQLSNDRCSPLHLAASNGDIPMIELLVERFGAEVDIENVNGDTPLHCAAANGHLDAVTALVEKYGARPEAKNRSGKLALDVALTHVKREVTEYLRTHRSAEEEASEMGAHTGFRRAGAWVGKGNADALLTDLSLAHVLLLPVDTLLSLGRFPNNYDCLRKKLLVSAEDISPDAMVLHVSHFWESPGNPDPSGRQFQALRDFLLLRQESNKPAAAAQPAAHRGGLDKRPVDYVWAMFSCVSRNRIKPDFKLHMHNLLTAWCRADQLLFIPRTSTSVLDGTRHSDFSGLERGGWCTAELVAALHLGVDVFVFVTHGGYDREEEAQQQPVQGNGAVSGSGDVSRGTSGTIAPEVEEVAGAIVYEHVSLSTAGDKGIGKALLRAVEDAADVMLREDPEAGLTDKERLVADMWSSKVEETIQGSVNLVARSLQHLELEVQQRKKGADTFRERLLSLMLGKRDFEVGENGEDGELESKKDLRELVNSLDGFSSEQERIEAVGCLLLAGAYCVKLFKYRSTRERKSADEEIVGDDLDVVIINDDSCSDQQGSTQHPLMAKYANNSPKIEKTVDGIPSCHCS